MTKDYRRLKKGNPQVGSGQRQSKARASKQDVLHQASHGVLPNRMLEAGNAAISHLLNEVSGGKPLPPATCSEMEKAFGTNFGEVRIHDDQNTQAKATAINAEAFTQNDHIHLGADAPSPQTSAGKKLLAHELAHVVQKRRAGGQQSSAINRSGDKFEAEADRAATSAVSGLPVELASAGVPPAVQRQSSSDPWSNLADKALEKGIGWGDRGWTIGGVPIKDTLDKIEMGAEVLAKVAEGDIEGAIEIVNPKDPEERKRLEEKFRKLKERMDAAKSVDERRREEEEKRIREEQTRADIARWSAKRLRLDKPDPKFKLSEPDPDTRFTMGATTPYVVDDFTLEKANLKPAHRKKLDDIAARANSNPNAEIEIVGHADTTGPLAFNKTLSEDRAGAVRDYLISHGVEPGKIKSVRGRGNEEPLVPEKTDADRARNRRVEINYWAGAVPRKKKTYGFGLGKLQLEP